MYGQPIESGDGIIAVKEELEYHRDFCSWGPVITYRRGAGGAEDFRGDHLIFRRTKGGISRN